MGTRVIYENGITGVSNGFNTVQFGKWENKPINWMVLEEDHFSMLLLSKLALFGWKWNNSRGGNYADSDIRMGLLGTFYNDAFTEEEKQRIINHKMNDVYTCDNVFLLSKPEFETLLTPEERKCGDGTGCNGHSCDNCYQFSDRHGTCCWTRTLFSDDRFNFRINADGGFDASYKDNYLSVRPSIKITKE